MMVWGSPSCVTGCSPRTAARAEAIAVAIEVPHGPVVEALLERGFRVHAINPKQLDRFRDRFTVAGAKDDRRDAHVLSDSLRTDRLLLSAPGGRGRHRYRVARMVAHDRGFAAAKRLFAHWWGAPEQQLGGRAEILSAISRM